MGTCVEFEASYKQRPENTAGCTMIVCSHPYHGVETFYLTSNQWQDTVRPLLTPYWINGYTMLMVPMD